MESQLMATRGDKQEEEEEELQSELDAVLQVIAEVMVFLMVVVVVMVVVMVVVVVVVVVVVTLMQGYHSRNIKRGIEVCMFKIIIVTTTTTYHRRQHLFSSMSCAWAFRAEHCFRVRWTLSCTNSSSSSSKQQ